MAARVVAGVHRACRAHAMALLGGETAEMPGLYKPGDFDLAGTIVGIVDIDADSESRTRRDRRCDPRAAVDRPAHQRLHARARVDPALMSTRSPSPERPLPTRCLRRIRRITRRCARSRAVADVKAMAHITGGGLARQRSAHAARRNASHLRTDTLERSADHERTRAARRISARRALSHPQYGHRLHADRPGQRKRSVPSAPCREREWSAGSNGGAPTIRPSSSIPRARKPILAVNLLVDFADERFDVAAAARAHRTAEALRVSARSCRAGRRSAGGLDRLAVRAQLVVERSAEAESGSRRISAATSRVLRPSIRHGLGCPGCARITRKPGSGSLGRSGSRRSIARRGSAQLCWTPHCARCGLNLCGALIPAVSGERLIALVSATRPDCARRRLVRLCVRRGAARVDPRLGQRNERASRLRSRSRRAGSALAPRRRLIA